MVRQMPKKLEFANATVVLDTWRLRAGWAAGGDEHSLDGVAF